MKNFALTLSFLCGFTIPATAQCNPVGILEYIENCQYQYKRLATTDFPHATYVWSIPGSLWTMTTTTNYVDIPLGALYPGQYNMNVDITCPNCTTTTGSATTTFTFSPQNCGNLGGILPEKRSDISQDSSSETFDGIDLARSLVDRNLYRVWNDKPPTSVELVNSDTTMDTFYIVTLNGKRQLLTKLVNLNVGETRTIPLNEDAREIYIISERQFVLFDGDHEWIGQKDDSIIRR